MVATRTLRTALNNEGMYDAIPIERFGGVAVDNEQSIVVTDANSDALDEAIDSIATNYHSSVPHYKGGPKIKFGYGNYYMSRPIQPNRTVFLEGLAGNSNSNTGWLTALTFPAGSAGVILRGFTQAGAVVTPGAHYSMFKDLRLQSLGFGGQTTAHGFDSNTQFTCENVTIGKFGGDGFHIVASVGIGPGSNANLWNIKRATTILNAGHGVYVQGSDANAGNGYDINATSNGGWGIWDDSFLGNSWYGCHTDFNTLGAYKSIGASARTLFAGCYSEGGQPTSLISPAALVVGGIHAAGITGGALVIDGANAQLSSCQIYNNSDTSGLTMEFRPGSDHLIRLNRPGGPYLTHSIRYDSGFTGAFGWNYGGLDGGWSYYLTTGGSTITAGRGAALAGNRHVYPESIFVGTAGHANARELGNATAMPTTGAYAQGDFILNRAFTISAGKVLLGWLRLVTGSAHVAGTDWTPIYGTTT